MQKLQLRRSGVDVNVTHASNDDVYDFVIGVAAEHDTLEAFADSLKALVKRG